MSVWAKLAEQVPSLVVLALVLYAFLSHLRGRDKTIEKMAEGHENTIKEVVAKHDAREEKAQEQSERQTAVVERNTVAFEKVDRTLERLTR